MASAIKQRIYEAKKELQDQLEGKGLDMESDVGDIEKMEETLEKQDFPDTSPEFNISSTEEIPDTGQVEQEPEDEPELEKEELESAEPEPAKVDEVETEEIDEESEDLDTGAAGEMHHGSSVTSPGVDSRIEPEPEEVEEINGDDTDHSYREKKDLEERVKMLESEIENHEERMVSEESKELGKINELEERVEKLELEDDQDLEKRLQRLENEIESLKSLENMNGRLTELEEQIISEVGVSDDVKEDIRRLDSRIDELWEALDEEFVSIESGIYENEENVDELLSMVLELSEALKKQMKDH